MFQMDIINFPLARKRDMKTHLTIVIAALAVFMLHTNSRSEDLPTECTDASIECGIAQGSLTLRDSPPSGPFYRNGKAIGVIEKGSHLIVEEQRDINMLFDEYEWIRVKSVNNSQSGWLYNGRITKDGGDLPYILLWKLPPS